MSADMQDLVELNKRLKFLHSNPEDLYKMRQLLARAEGDDWKIPQLIEVKALVESYDKVYANKGEH